MIGLSHILPPLASDYSGAASLLYEHGVMCVMCDADCCTANYLACDEPRWRGGRQGVYCISLRTLDVTLGNEAALVDRIVRTVRESGLDAPAIALVGTPVPAITGMDVQGMACEVEELAGIPAVGIPTGGFKSYDAGLLATFKALLERFGGGAGRAAEGCGAGSCGGTFVLGASLFDYAADSVPGAALQNLDSAVLCPDPLADAAHGTGLDVYSRLSGAGRVIAASNAGIRMAMLLEKRHGVAYSVGLPLDAGPLELDGCGRVLIVHDQVVANSIRDSLEKLGGAGEVRVASLAGWHTRIARAGDTRTPDEASLKELLRAWRPDAVVGDPLLAGMLSAAGCKGCKLVPLPWPALSGRLGW